MIILNSKYFPPVVVSHSYSHEVILSTVVLSGLYCETITNGFDLDKSVISYVNNNGNICTINV